MDRKKLNIFYVIADSSLTGAPRHLLSLIDGLNPKDFSLSVILPPGSLVDELKKRKVHIFTVPMRARSDMAAVNAVKKLLRKYDPDIMHAHGQRAGLIARWAAKGLPIKVIYTEHTRTLQFKLGNPVLDWAHIKAMRALDKWTDMNIAVSQAVADFLIKYKITKPEKIQIIHNSIESKPKAHIDEDTLGIINQYGLRKKDIIIGTIGSLNIQKDTATLIKAMTKVIKRLPQSKLVIVGSGPLKFKLQKLAKKLKITDHVIFTGSIKNISSILQLFTIFVLPSRSEAFGISILEAMRAGVPIIATKVGGIPEIITNNRDGILIEPGQPKLLASGIMKLINNKKLQAKLSKEGLETIKRFSIDKMIQETSRVYKGLFKKK